MRLSVIAWGALTLASTAGATEIQLQMKPELVCEVQNARYEAAGRVSFTQLCNGWVRHQLVASVADAVPDGARLLYEGAYYPIPSGHVVLAQRDTPYFSRDSTISVVNAQGQALNVPVNVAILR